MFVGGVGFPAKRLTGFLNQSLDGLAGNQYLEKKLIIGEFRTNLFSRIPQPISGSSLVAS